MTKRCDPEHCSETWRHSKSVSVRLCGSPPSLYFCLLRVPRIFTIMSGRYFSLLFGACHSVLNKQASQYKRTSEDSVDSTF